jgi:hypothetical protein
MRAEQDVFELVKGMPCRQGFFIKDVGAAPLILCSESALIIAPSSITGPRPTLMITALGFMAANSLVPTSLRVSAFSGAATTT